MVQAGDGGIGVNPEVYVPRDRIASFCEKRGIVWMAIFGSALRSDFRTDSDIDVLVRFDPSRTPGLIRLSAMERELSGLFGDRKVDLRTPENLSRYFRDKAVDEAETVYERE